MTPIERTLLRNQQLMLRALSLLLHTPGIASFDMHPLLRQAGTDTLALLTLTPEEPEPPYDPTRHPDGSWRHAYVNVGDRMLPVLNEGETPEEGVEYAPSPL